MYSAFLLARGAVDAAVPEAGAVLVPAAVPATADRDLVPTPAPSLVHRRGRRPSLRRGLAPGPSPSLAPEAVLLHPTEFRGPGLRPRPPSPRETTEPKLRRHQTQG